MSEEKVTMSCYTYKKSFEVTDPPVVRLKNGRYAYRVECPWEGKNGKTLYAFKFCSAAAYEKQNPPEAKDAEDSPDDS